MQYSPSPFNLNGVIHFFTPPISVFEPDSSGICPLSIDLRVPSMSHFVSGP